MLMTLTAVLVGLTALRSQAVAAPATTSQAFVTKFDDLTPTKLSMIKPIPGPQDGLFFGGFTYRSDGIPQIVAKSSPNLIGFSNLRKTLGLAAPISNITNTPGPKSNPIASPRRSSRAPSPAPVLSPPFEVSVSLRRPFRSRARSNSRRPLPRARWRLRRARIRGRVWIPRCNLASSISRTLPMS
ncbi:MAG: hypothetical protein L6R36_005931 [Xanthoria steineri]|nr:MAG: hypothetical protein L6R36_005931 [Xanthoria steineri]